MRIEASSSSTMWYDRQRPAELFERRGDLERGSRGCWRRRRPAGWRRMFARLSLAQLPRGLGLDEVVNPGRPAADRRLGHFDNLQAGDRRQHLPGLELNPLGVLEVTGVVVRDTQRHGWRGARGGRSARTSETSRHLRGECAGAVGVGRVVAQQVAVLLHRRAAAGGVDDDACPRSRLRTRRSSAGRARAPRPLARRGPSARRSTPAARG